MLVWTLVKWGLFLMDYYESIVVSYLRADRALFVNTECCIQLSLEHLTKRLNR